MPKISQLNTVTSVTDADSVPIVQGGTTKKASREQLLHGENATSNVPPKDVRLKAGNAYWSSSGADNMKGGDLYLAPGTPLQVLSVDNPSLSPTSVITLVVNGTEYSLQGGTHWTRSGTASVTRDNIATAINNLAISGVTASNTGGNVKISGTSEWYGYSDDFAVANAVLGANGKVILEGAYGSVALECPTPGTLTVSNPEHPIPFPDSGLLITMGGMTFRSSATSGYIEYYGDPGVPFQLQGNVMVMTVVGEDVPTTDDIPDGFFCMWKNTDDSSLKLYANDGGALKSVALS